MSNTDICFLFEKRNGKVKEVCPDDPELRNTSPDDSVGLFHDNTTWDMDVDKPWNQEILDSFGWFTEPVGAAFDQPDVRSIAVLAAVTLSGWLLLKFARRNELAPDATAAADRIDELNAAATVRMGEAEYGLEEDFEVEHSDEPRSS